MKAHSRPRIWLEQYTIPADVAADILYLATFTYGDIKDRVVMDLGTGTGRLAIGAALLGARQAIGVDVDPNAIEVARQNSNVARLEVEWIVGDLDAIHGPFDTVVMNPPFGTKRKHLDKLFLGKALRMAPVVYSIHKSSTRDHILRYVERQGFSVRAIHEYKFEIPRMFEHHRKRRYEVRVDCYRMLAGRLSTKSAR